MGGFLGVDESLEAVITADARTLSELGLTHDRLADALDRVLARARINDFEVAVDGRFKVNEIMSFGDQECPWGVRLEDALFEDQPVQPCASSSWEWEIRNTHSGREMRGPGMITHLIREHHFFEGFNSPYRVDPRQLAELLDLQTDARA
jgi:hypothetical protein